MPTAWRTAGGVAVSIVSLTSLYGDGVAAAETSSRLQIQIPTELFRSDGYSHQEALFGIPRYGGSIAERLLYGGNGSAPWQLCTDDDSRQFVNPDSTKPFVLMVDRGDCTFVAKVRRAQHLGAAGVLIADNKCMCSDRACASAEECEAVEPIMADDGSGADITTPSFLMRKPDADLIKTHLQAKQWVQCEMTWSLPAPDDRVEWSLWTSSIDPTASTFKQDFKDVHLALGTHTFFEPFYVLYDGAQYGCAEDAHHCGNLCTNGGRYCMTDPDFDRQSGLSGADVVKESLRQKCIWNYYGGTKAPAAQQGIGEKWWSYVNNFTTTCGTERFTDASCINGVMSKVGIDAKVIDRCMTTESGGLETDGQNSILEGELQEKGTKTIVIIPTVYVNNVVERGGINTAAVLTTICAGYSSGTEPDTCRCAGQPSGDAVKNCLANWGPGGGGTTIMKGVSVGAVLGIIIGMVTAMTAAGFVYYKRTQDQMRDQVRGILAEYMPLEDMDAPGANARVPFMRASTNGHDHEGEYRGPYKETQLV